MVLSVNNNNAALIALQNLNSTETMLQTTQNDVSTGLSVNTAQDNAAVWSIAQGQRADISALDAVTMSLNRATSISDVASTAGQSVSDLLTQVKAKIVAAMDPSLNTASRQALNSDFATSLLGQINDVVNNAGFDGTNLLDGSSERTSASWAMRTAVRRSLCRAINMTIGGSGHRLRRRRRASAPRPWLPPC